MSPARDAYEKVVKYMDEQVRNLTSRDYDEMLTELEAREQARKEEQAEQPE